MQQTLVLDQGYQPHRVVSWQRAVVMVFDNKVEVVEEYEELIRSISLSLKMPAVVRLLNRVRRPPRRVRFSRINVATRDDFTCQYCKKRLPLARLTYDHVLPRSQGGKTSWQNIVMACHPCNERKADRTPIQAGMHLSTSPHEPKWLPTVTMRLNLEDVPSAWASWIYWNVALEEG